MTILSNSFRIAAGTVLGIIALSAPVETKANGISTTSESKVTVITSVTSGAAGQSQAGHSFSIRARVPVACWIRPDQPVEAGEGVTGGVYEACNNPGGYIVTANHRPLSASEKAKLYYDDQAFDLGQIGAQVLRQSTIATIKRVNYRFGDVRLDSPLSLSLTIQPI